MKKGYFSSYLIYSNEMTHSKLYIIISINEVCRFQVKLAHFILNGQPGVGLKKEIVSHQSKSWMEAMTDKKIRMVYH